MQSDQAGDRQADRRTGTYAGGHPAKQSIRNLAVETRRLEQARARGIATAAGRSPSYHFAARNHRPFINTNASAPFPTHYPARRTAAGHAAGQQQQQQLLIRQIYLHLSPPGPGAVATPTLSRAPGPPATAPDTTSGGRCLN